MPFVLLDDAFNTTSTVTRPLSPRHSTTSSCRSSVWHFCWNSSNGTGVQPHLSREQVPGVSRAIWLEDGGLATPRRNGLRQNDDLLTREAMEVSKAGAPNFDMLGPVNRMANGPLALSARETPASTPRDTSRLWNLHKQCIHRDENSRNQSTHSLCPVGHHTTPTRADLGRDH